MTATEEQAKAITIPRRAALLEGACGQIGRVQICGQILDLLLPLELAKEAWEPFHNLPIDSLGLIRPIEDLSMSAVRGARLQIEILKVEPQSFKLEQADSYEILFSSPVLKGRGNGFFNYLLPERDNLGRGEYVVRVILRGIDSARQSLLDLRYINDESKQVLQKNQSIGYGKLCILGADFKGLVIISDIDQTFLDTQIENKEALLKSLGEKAHDKKTISGMPELYRQLSSLTESSALLLFLSASPHFFRRTLTSLFEKHNIHSKALYLKYLAGVIDNLSTKFLELAKNPSQFLTGKNLASLLNEGMKYISTQLLSLFDQIGYKLEMLLGNRIMQPSQSREILMGDNSESDFFIFTLYQLLLKGHCLGSDLEDYLSRFSFQGREALTRENMQKLCTLTQKNIDLHGKKNPVCAVWINKAKKELDKKSLEEMVLASLSPALQEAYSQDPDIIPIRLCEKGLGMALAAYDEDILSPKSVALVFISSQEDGYIKEELEESLEKFSFQKKKRLSKQDLAFSLL